MLDGRVLSGGAALALAGLVGLGSGAGPAVAAAGAPGSVALVAAAVQGAQGAGDPYFPHQGNGGYDVSHYSLRLTYDPATRHLRGKARIKAVTKRRLSTFDLDFRHALQVRWVRVNGHAASFTQPAHLKQELVVRPKHRLAKGKPFVVAVRYAGAPKPVTDPTDRWRVGSPRRTAPSSSESPRAHRPGSPATTHLATRRRTTSGSACRAALPRWPTAT
jgi:hypothetical protein